MKAAFARRFERLLVVIPFLARRPAGVPIDEVVEFGGYRDSAELYADIRLVGEVALPPEGPGDFVEVYIENGRVFAALPQAFRKPPRLTVAEAAAFIAAARPFEAVGTPLASALAKLRRAIPGDDPAVVDSLAAGAEMGGPSPPETALLVEAARRRVEVEVVYLSRSTGATTTRILHPRRVFAHRGRWYVEAGDTFHGDERVFRIDRMLAVRVGTRTFAPARPALRVEQELLYFPTPADRDVVLRFTPSAAQYVLSRWGDAARKETGGSVTVKFRSASENYVVSLVLAYGGEAAVVSPAQLRKAVADRVRELRKVYANSASSRATASKRSQS